jgi:hypothetical protein
LSLLLVIQNCTDPSLSSVEVSWALQNALRACQPVCKVNADG